MLVAHFLPIDCAAAHKNSLGVRRFVAGGISHRRHHSPNHRRSTRVATTVNTTIHSATTSAPHEVGPGGSGKRAGGRIIDVLLVPAFTLSARICRCQAHNATDAHYGRESSGSRRGCYMMVISICVRVKEGERGRDVKILFSPRNSDRVLKSRLSNLRAKFYGLLPSWFHASVLTSAAEPIV
jgi:hypothetical protein